jgi:hypothetical protein
MEPIQAAGPSYRTHMATPDLARQSAAQVFRDRSVYLRQEADKMEVLAKVAERLETGSEAEVAMFEVACRQ